MMDKSIEQTNIPSGVHRFAGDPIHLKLRIVFTDAAQVTKKPDTSSIVSRQKQTTHFQKYLDKQVDDESVLALGGAQSRTSYLLTKHNLATDWNIEHEVMNDSGLGLGMPYPLSSHESNSDNDPLAAQLHRSGFRLKVVSVPTSRIDCSACSKSIATANNTITLIKPHLSPHDNSGHTKETSDSLELANSRNNLANSREHMVRDNHIFEHLLRYRNEIKRSDLLLKRQRASDCIDSPPNMTSDDDCNDYWKRTQARRLAAIYYISKKHNQTISAAANTVSLLMRNHYLPLYKPCHCSSRISMDRNFKTLNDSGSLFCCLCSSCEGTRNNEHRNLDGQIDNLHLPISALGRCLLAGVSSDPICHCRCHCSDFSEVYKRRQKLFNKFDPKDIAQNVANLPNIVSSNGFVHKDADDESLSEKKQTKYDEDGDDNANDDDDDGDGESIDYDSAVSFDLLLASLGHKTDTKAINGANVYEGRDEEKPSSRPREHYQTFKNFQSNDGGGFLRGELGRDQRTSTGGKNIDIQRDIFTESCREWKKLELQNEICDLGQNVTGRCRCSESHGETLLVIMEKYASIPEKEPQLEFTSASSGSQAGFTTKNSASAVRANREEEERELNETIDSDAHDKKSDSRVIDIDKQMLPQQLQQDSPSRREFNVRSSSFSKPIDKSLGTLSSADDHDTDESLISSRHETVRRLEATAFVKNDQVIENGRQDKRTSGSRNEYNSQSDQLEDPTTRGIDDSIRANERQRNQQQQQQQSQLLKQQRLCQLQSLPINENVEELAAVGGTVELRPHVELEYSILLTVIVIDVFNRTIQVKPDLNKLIMLDLGALMASNDATCDFVSGVHMTQRNNPIQMRQRHMDRLFYHVESVHSTDVISTMENHVEIVRHRLGLTQKVGTDSVGLDSEIISPTKVQRGQLVKDDLSSFLIPTNGNVIVKLQFGIHYVQGLPRDCNNVHVRYKLFSRYNKRWSIERRHFEEIKVASNECRRRAAGYDVTRLASMAGKLISSHLDGTGTKCNELKLDQMAQFKGVWSQPSLDMSSLATNANHLRADGDSRFEAIKRLDYSEGSQQHEPLHDECCSDDDKPGHSNETPLILLLEGSTITSRPNKDDCFHLCCTEQISLELSRKDTNIKTQRGDTFFQLNRERRRDDMVERRATSSHVAEQKSHQLTGEKNHSGLSKTIDDSPPINEQFSTSSSLTKDQTTSAAVISENDREDRGAHRTILKETADNVNEESLKTCARCLRTKNTCLCGGGGALNPSQDERFHDASSELFSDDSNDLCKLVLVFEIYSSDFYGDKLQGWSFTDVPISVSRSPIMNSDNGDYKLLPQSASALSPDGASASIDRDSGLSNECNLAHHELPVIRPNFCAPIDRLRYYLLGEVPKTTPRIESVSKFDVMVAVTD